MKPKTPVEPSKAKIVLAIDPYWHMQECIERGLRYGLNRFRKYDLLIDGKKNTLVCKLSEGELIEKLGEYIIDDMCGEGGFVFLKDPDVEKAGA